MYYIDFEILFRLFKSRFELSRTFGREIGNNAGNARYMGKNDICLLVPSDRKTLEEIDWEISNEMERKIKNYLNSCPATSWPIILKSYLEQISKSFDFAKKAVFIFNKVDTSDSASLEGTQYEGLDLYKSLYKAGELEENSRYALLICSMAFSIVKDLADRYCPENKDLNELFPAGFFNTPSGTEREQIEEPEEYNDLECAMMNNDKFQYFISKAREKGWFDKSLHWTYIKNESDTTRIGSLCYFIGEIYTKAKIEGAYKHHFPKLFPDTAAYDNTKLTDKKRKFSNTNVNSAKNKDRVTEIDEEIRKWNTSYLGKIIPK